MELLQKKQKMYGERSVREAYEQSIVKITWYQVTRHWVVAVVITQYN